MSIINTYPTTLQNGQVEDATVVMTLFAWIQSQVNGNACGATTGSTLLKGDGAGNTTPAVAGTDYSAGTQALATGVLKSTTTTGALTIASLSDFTSLGLAASGANADITSLSVITSINSGPLYGNRIKNANKLLAQRATSATVTAGTAVPTASTGYPTIDRFYGYCTGANVTASQVAGYDPTNSRVQYTGAASVTAIGHGTRLEASETAHMAGQTCTYSVELANSLLTTVTWTAYYANTANTFGTVGTPTKTLIATGTFTVSSTVTKYSTQIAVPAGATTGIEIVLTVGAQTSGTWTIGREDFRLGSVSPTVWEVPDITQETLRCQRYFYQVTNYSLGLVNSSSYLYSSGCIAFPATMRTTPSLVAGATFFVNGGSAGTPALITLPAGSGNGPTGVGLYNTAANWTVGAVVAVTAGFVSEIP